MSRCLKTVALFVVIITTLVVVSFRANAQTEPTTPTENQLNTIIYRCPNMKTTIKQMQTQDAITRVELGKNYENMLSKLMTPMNSRLANNQLSAGNLLTITADFNSNLGSFRQHYIEYDQSISDLLSIDCAKKPADFYNKLQTARAKRANVQADCLKLSQAIKSYREELKLVTLEIH